MRALIPVFLAALLLATPAHAGLRATYVAGEGGKELVIEAADNGNARIGETGKPDYGLLLDDSFYIVGRDEAGAATVARIEDVAAAIDRVVPPIFRDIFAKAAQGMPVGRALKMTRAGERTLGGRTGTVSMVAGLNDEKPDETAEFVMSADPDLRPVGRAMEQFMNAAILPGAVFLGPAAAGLIGETRQIFALGAPLDAGGRFRLHAVETVEVRPERLALPAAASTVDELVGAMTAGQKP